MTGRVRLGALVAAVAFVFAASACSGSASTEGTYTFSENDSPVKVDTPQLRALKNSTGIQPCPASVSAGDPVDGGLPATVLPCLGGGANVDLAALRGPLVLNFWAQTCGPCRQESPMLQKFATAATGRVTVMGVDFYDPRPSYAIAFAKELGITYPQLADPAAATRAPLRISGLPMTFLVDKSGRIAYTQVGALTSEHQLESLVEEHLGVSGPFGSSR